MAPSANPSTTAAAKTYDLIVVGTGSAMNLVDPFLRQNPKAKIAVIDKDQPGGICLTRGCIPTKLLTYPAEVAEIVRSASKFGIKAKIEKIDFAKVMARMHAHVDPEIESIRKGLSTSPNIDYHHAPAKFVAPYVLEVNGQRITSNTILLCAGSKVTLPPIEGLSKIRYHTSDTILHITKLPKRLLILGGGYIAAEFGHFFSGMGSEVTIVGRNEQFLPDEEPEISASVRSQLERRLTIVTGVEGRKITAKGRRKALDAVERKSGRKRTFEVDEVLVATGRSSNADVLRPEAGGIRTDKDGWIETDEYLETSQKGVWAMGDCRGRHLFKHVANYDSLVVYQNAFLGRKVKADYSVVPHAVFTYPEVAGVGLREAEAVERFGPQEVLIGSYRYEDTAKGEAIAAEGDFVKAIVRRSTGEILGCHIVGPYASILIQEVINVMRSGANNVNTITEAMHIHPALPEVVERAFGALRPPGHRH